MDISKISEEELQNIIDNDIIIFIDIDKLLDELGYKVLVINI